MCRMTARSDNKCFSYRGLVFKAPFLYLSTADGFRDGRKRALRRNCKKYIFFNCTVEKERNMCYNKKT